MLHLLTLKDWSQHLIEEVVRLAIDTKNAPEDYANTMYRKTLFMIFEKPSLRTRVSFETGMNQLGGHAIFYDLINSPLRSGKENIHDTVKTISRYGDLIMARLFDHRHLEEMAAFSEIPVINGLTDFAHPCQILADLLTIFEEKGFWQSHTLAYLGDSNNNVTHSLLYGCTKMGIHIQIGCPADNAYRPNSTVVAEAEALGKENNTRVFVTHDPQEAVHGADIIYADSWMSYHIPQEEHKQRVETLQPYQVNSKLMKEAKPDAIFMNCLPAMRGYEQTADIIDGPQSVVFNQAENRLHAQKAIMIKLLKESEEKIDDSDRNLC